ncbi:tetratricopeptide repeat protein [Marinobacter fonticola]|uniref:tetratricopeptide repeat protein n=1 Tax=Marinobacter fonticola TaxID=2603215 RepID=UPI001D0D83D1|nr:hypothetical protein [Marinobacter fonticola]
MLLTLLGVVLISGCAGLNDRNLLASSSDFFSRTGDALRKIGEPTPQVDYEAERQALFDQPYIDPLTEYLHRFEADVSRAALLTEVRQERERRCDVIFKRYSAEPPTSKKLARYRGGYNFSCSDDVETYATMLEKQQADIAARQLAESAAAKAEPPDAVAEAAEETPPKPGRKVVSQQLSDCYLLTAIRNFSDALAACRGPAENGNVQAQTNMATIAYALQDYATAHDWARRAAPESADAANLLGEMHAAGHGVPSNRKAARTWYQQAASLGHAGAQAALDNSVKISAGDELQ